MRSPRTTTGHGGRGAARRRRRHQRPGDERARTGRAEEAHLAARHAFHIYDALIVAAALAADCTTVYSEDLHDGQVVDHRLTIQNPFLHWLSLRVKRPGDWLLRDLRNHHEETPTRVTLGLAGRLAHRLRGPRSGAGGLLAGRSRQ